MPKRQTKFDAQQYHAAYQAERRAFGNEVAIRKCRYPRRRDANLRDPLRFLKYYFEDRFFRPYSDDQREAIKIIEHAATYGGDEIVAAPRGEWKTETTKGMIIYIMLKRLQSFPVVIGKNATQSVALYSDIKHQFENNARLAADFPEICTPVRHLGGSAQKGSRQTCNGRRTRIEWKADFCLFPQVDCVYCTGKGCKKCDDTGEAPYNKLALAYRSLDSAIRGINIQGRRPTFALIDDPETEESARSDYQIKVRTRLIDNDIGGLAGSGERLTRMILGTVQNQKCIVNKKLKEWGGKRYKGVKAWPHRLDLWEQFIDLYRAEKETGEKEHTESYDFVVKHFKAMHRGANVASPDCITKKTRADGRLMFQSRLHFVYCEWADKGREFVMCEIQNDPTADDSVIASGITATIVASRKSGLRQFDLPADTEIVSVGFDVGKYACHWAAAAWSKRAAGSVFDYGIQEVQDHVRDDPKATEVAIFNALCTWRDDVMQWPRVPDIVLVDSGTFTEAVYQFIRESDLPFMAAKGTGETKFRHGEASNTRLVGEHWFASYLLEKYIWLYNLDTDHWKTWMHNRWLASAFDENQQRRAGSLANFISDDPRRHHSFDRHIVSEEKVEQWIEGKGLRRIWLKTNRNNHWLDAAYMMCAGACMKGIRIPLGKPNLKPAARQQQTRPRSKSSRTPGGQPFLASERK